MERSFYSLPSQKRFKPFCYKTHIQLVFIYVCLSMLLPMLKYSDCLYYLFLLFFSCMKFDMWTGSQRREFFDIILLHCTKKQLFYIQNWFIERVPLRHLDFTKVLPRFLSLYIFSFLDPRSLSRASMVSWHWKFLTEQVKPLLAVSESLLEFNQSRPVNLNQSI